MGKKVTGACKENKVTEPVKRVYAFGKDAQGNNVTEGNTTMKATLGGKGANLAEMANIGLPVPPGFTISCQTCMEYANAGNVWPEGVLDTIHEYRLDLENRIGKKIGDAEDPLLVSVRSGAPMSMPGMMDTVLNLGLNDESINGLIKQTENPRFAWDSYRRFIQMFSNVVMGLDGDLFENAINGYEGGARREVRHRPYRGRPARARRGVQGHLHRERLGRGIPGACRRRLRAVPAGPDGAAQACHRGCVRQLEQPPRGPLPQEEQDLRRPGHRRQRAVHGLRQQGQHVGHGRRVHAQPRQRCEGILRRLPGKRPGRRRRRGHPQHEPHRRAQACGRPRGSGP